MKNKDIVLLEQAYQHVREGLWDKTKEFVNKNVVQYDTNAPGGEAHEQEKAVLPYKNVIEAIVKLLSNGKCDPPEANRYPKNYINYAVRAAANFKVPGASDIWNLIHIGNGDVNVDHPISKALIDAYNPNTMKDLNPPQGEPDDFEDKARGASLRDQQKFAMQRSRDLGQDY